MWAVKVISGGSLDLVNKAFALCVKVQADSVLTSVLNLQEIRFRSLLMPEGEPITMLKSGEERFFHGIGGRSFSEAVEGLQ